MVKIVVCRERDGYRAINLFPGTQIGGKWDVLFELGGDYIEYEELRKQVAGICRANGCKKVVGLYHDQETNN